MNIIVRMPNWLGDLVMATPILQDIKNKWPESEITVMCQSGIASILENDPHIDELFSFERPSSWLRRTSQRDILQPIRHGKYDIGILLTNSLSSAVWFWRGGVKKRIGFKKNMRTPILTDALHFPDDVQKRHLVSTYKHLLLPLGIPLSETTPTLYISSEEANVVQKTLRTFGIPRGAPILGINPGAAYGSAKCWLPERFIEASKILLERTPNLHILYFGDPAGKSLVDSICQHLPSHVINLAAKTTLRELPAYIDACTLFLTNDSGPMHIAAALGTPLVALFGSTSDVKTSPYGTPESVIHKHAACSPCYQRTCPIDFRCMKGISSQEVADRLSALL